MRRALLVGDIACQLLNYLTCEFSGSVSHSLTYFKPTIFCLLVSLLSPYSIVVLHIKFADGRF